MNIVRAIRQLRRSVGLEPVGFTDYIAPAVGLLAVGMLAGAGVALLFAPTSGKKLREDMEQRFGDLRSRFMLEEAKVEASLRAALPQTPAHQNSVKPIEHAAKIEPFPRS